MTTPDSATPIAKPDYDHWSRMARWDMDQATALALDLDPDGFATRAPEAAPERYTKLRAIVASHVSAGRLPHFAEPADFLAWALANGVAVSTALQRAVEAQHGIIADWRHLNALLSAEVVESRERIVALENERLELHAISEANATRQTMPERPLLPKEEKSLLALVLGMAMDAYDFRADGRRSPAISKIKSGLARCGINVDEDTIRKWVNRAADEIDLNLVEATNP